MKSVRNSVLKSNGPERPEEETRNMVGECELCKKSADLGLPAHPSKPLLAIEAHVSALKQTDEHKATKPPSATKMAPAAIVPI